MKKLFLAISLLMVLSTLSPMEVIASQATEQLQGDVDRIIETLNDEGLDGRIRDERIVSIVKGRFDFPTMSQWILGINWRRANEAERQRFIDLFTRLLENTYVSRIETYTGEYGRENVRYVQERIEGNRALVNTLIVTKSAEIPVDYKMILSEGKWLVYDVVIEEISLVRNYRSTYSEIVSKEGFSGLFARMEEKIAELAKAPTEVAK
ncbi:MAG: ABC transporter substrate-binding protein [Desulfuromonadaceae bacterium]|nr:ABC transporter substrate-binding protein [Desulfuromonadaceae bacterium]